MNEPTRIRMRPTIPYFWWLNESRRARVANNELAQRRVQRAKAARTAAAGSDGSRAAS
jgi:hypothetical protein